MFKYLRLKSEPPKVAPDPSEFSVHQLIGDFELPISIHAVNTLPLPAKRRIYRLLVPPAVLTRWSINPNTWRGPEQDAHVQLTANPDSSRVHLAVRDTAANDPGFVVELADNDLNGIDLNLLLLNDPASPRFDVDVTADGKPTYFGTVHRNLAEEARACQAGLAPAQMRASLHASRAALDHLDIFLAFLSHRAVFLEPLTYASAWVFERRGFAYVRGHKLMDDIHREFQPGGKLHAALDDSTPFRAHDHWRTVRGRAWAIHDGILSVLGATWNDVRMTRQVGRNANVNTLPDVPY